MKQSKTSSSKGNSMLPEDLSKSYMVATSMIHEEATQLYESLHISDGTPISERDIVYALVKNTRKKILMEIDMVIEAVKQYND